MMTPTQVENLIRFLINEIIKLIQATDIEKEVDQKRLYIGINELFKDIDIGLSDHIPQTIVNRYLEGVKQAEKDLGGVSVSIGKDASNSLNKVINAPKHTEAISSIVNDTMLDLAAATRTAKVYTNKNVDIAINDVRDELSRGMIKGMDTKNISKRVAQKFYDQGMTAFVTVDGKHLPLDFYAKTVTRTKMRTAINHGTLNRYEDRKVKHVYVAGNIPTCGECAKYRGIVFATDRNDSDFPYIDLHKTFPLHPNCECNFRPWISKFKSKQQMDEAKAKAKQFNPKVDPRVQAERDKYKNEQKKRQVVRRKQMSYNKMKTKLGKEGPQSYGEFTDAFNNNRPLYHKWVAQMKDKNIRTNELSNNEKDDIINQQEELDIASEQWKSKLNEQEKEVVEDYTGTYNELINTVLNENQKEIDLKLQEKINLLSSAIKKFEYNKEVIAYRGISKLEFDIITGGNNVFKEFKSFKSTSIDEEIAKRFSTKENMNDDIFQPINHYILIARISKNVNGAFIKSISDNPEENEFLLDKNSKYRFIPEETFEVENITYITIEVIE